MVEYIEREAAKLRIFEYGVRHRNNSSISFACENLERQMGSIPAADVRPVPEGGIGEMSDGYHTFNGLYYQRMVLFAALVKVYKGMAWKSWRHEDGGLCFGKDNYFIVGIDTPKGSYTYHYHGEHWDLFDCEELPVAKHWDGHTEEDVTRLLSLDVRPVVRGKWISRRFSDSVYGAECSVCHTTWDYGTNYCPNCGADMGKSGTIATSMGGHMKESEKWLALCDPSCQQKKSFPNCECCDIALEYRYYKQKEQSEECET